MENKPRKSIQELRNENNAIKILVDIECILDTRAALIHEIDPTALKPILENGYHQRISDNFNILHGRFDMDEYRKRWAERNEDLLMQSTITNLPSTLLFMILKKILTDRDSMPVQPMVFLDINFGRYSGFPTEHYKLWLEMFKDIVPVEIFLEYCFYEKEYLTPVFVNKNYQHVFMYEWSNWFEHHYPATMDERTVRQHVMLNTDFYFPAMIKNVVEMSEFAENVAARGGDFFTDLAKTLSNILAPRFIDSDLVSVINPTSQSRFMMEYKNEMDMFNREVASTKLAEEDIKNEFNKKMRQKKDEV